MNKILVVIILLVCRLLVVVNYSLVDYWILWDDFVVFGI